MEHSGLTVATGEAESKVDYIELESDESLDDDE